MTQPAVVDVERVTLIPRSVFHDLVEFAADPYDGDDWEHMSDAATWPTPQERHDLMCHQLGCVDIACRP